LLSQGACTLFTEQAAVELAIRELQRVGGGSYTVYDTTGSIVSQFNVPGLGDTGSFRSMYSDHVAEPAEKLAGWVDDALGREKPESPLGELGEKSPDTVLPPSITKSAAFTDGRNAVAWSGFLLAVVGLISTGTLSAVVAKFSSALKSEADFDAYLTFGAAFWATFPLSVAAAVGVLALLIGEVSKNPHGFGIAWVLGSAAFTVVCTSIGMPGPTWDAMYHYMIEAGSSPLQRVGGLLQAYLVYFGLAPFLGGLITGSATGWFLARRTGRMSS
jgi:hypothetical protein